MTKKTSKNVSSVKIQCSRNFFKVSKLTAKRTFSNNDPYVLFTLGFKDKEEKQRW